MTITLGKTVAVTGICILLVFSSSRVRGIDQPEKSPDSGKPVGPQLDWMKISGSEKCVDCHRAEYHQWRDSPHGAAAYDKLRGDSAAAYAKKLGLSSKQMLTDSNCLKCHATEAVTFRKQRTILKNVACEACHNPSGGDKGWLNLHAVYGTSKTKRNEESDEHYKKRSAQSLKAGQLGGKNSYLLVLRCYECHRVGDEALLEKTGHKYGVKETFKVVMDEPKKDKVRHNFHVNQTKNEIVSSLWLTNPFTGKRNAADRKRLLKWLATLAEIEVTLSQLGSASPDTKLFSSAGDALFGAVGTTVDEDDKVLLKHAMIKEILEAALDIDPCEFSKDDQKECRELSKRLHDAAISFSREVDPSKLPDLNE